MDNLLAHKSSLIWYIAQDKSVKILFTPPYSPIFSPVENCFGLVKS